MGIAVPVRWSLRLVEIVHPTPEKELIVYLQATSADLAMEFHEVTPIVIAFMGAAATVLFAIPLFATQQMDLLEKRLECTRREDSFVGIPIEMGI
jgi:CBS-domain-containing membrane protein